jgi:CrcB protein
MKYTLEMKGLEFVFLAAGSVLGAFLRYKVTESPLLFNTLPVNVLIVNVIGAFILGGILMDDIPFLQQ